MQNHLTLSIGAAVYHDHRDFLNFQGLEQPVRQRRQSSSERTDHPTRQRLVEATARQIQAVGFERVDFDAVLAEVGATKGALYHHFGSVNDLLIAGLVFAFEEGIRESKDWGRALQEDCKSAKEARQFIRDIIAETQTVERRPFRSLRLHTLSLVLTEPSLAEKIAQLQAELNETATEAFREMQRRKWMRDDLDPHVIGVMLQTLTLGRIVDDVVADERKMDVKAWRKLYEQIFDGFFIVN